MVAKGCRLRFPSVHRGHEEEDKEENPDDDDPCGDDGEVGDDANDAPKEE